MEDYEICENCLEYFKELTYVDGDEGRFLCPECLEEAEAEEMDEG